MKRSSYVSAALVVLLVSVADAEDRFAGDLGKAPLTRPSAGRPAVSMADSVNSNTLRQVLAREFTIEPGFTTYFEWFADLSGSQRVGISVTTLSNPRSTLSNLRIAVAFAAPGDWYIISDVIFGSSFFYLDHGAFTVPVYGPLMKLAVTNDGALPVRITQLVAYAVAH